MNRALVWIAFGVICYLIGYNVGIREYSSLWPTDRPGLQNLMSELKKDDSFRIAIGVMTKKSVYVTQQVNEDKYKVEMHLYEKTE